MRDNMTIKGVGWMRFATKKVEAKRTRRHIGIMGEVVQIVQLKCNFLGWVGVWEKVENCLIILTC